MELTEMPVRDLANADSLDTAKYAVCVLDARRGKEIKLLHVEKHTSIADYFVLATGSSRTQVNALADEVAYRLGLCGVPLLRREGGESGVWTLLDFGAVIVHVFSRDGREFYHLEKLFEEGAEVDIASLLTEN